MTKWNFASLAAGVVLLLASTRAGAQSSPADPSRELRGAATLLERGDFQAAEKALRAEVAAHPDDAWALSLLGAALDNLKRIPEADAIHRRAVAKAPRSAAVLNNYAAHLWMIGKESEAKKVYLQILALDPAHYEANLQLARLALKERNGPETLRYLDRIPPSQRENAQVLLPRLEALYLSGNRPQADALATRLSKMAATDLNLGFAAGIALSNAGQYGQSEAFFENTLKGNPADFSVLYDLGVAAAHAGHYGRAHEALEAALQQQPENVDVLYALACAVAGLKQAETAVHLLAHAAKLDPGRADVQKMLAITTTDLGALEDAAAAWDRYLKLAPEDEIARRERGYTLANLGKQEQGIADLEWFVARHPGDATGHYELGQAERGTDIAKALMHFDKALAIDSNYLPARTARGSLFYQEGKPEAAVKDLEIAVSLRPDAAASLDRLGQTYQALDRTADALRVLRRASELVPGDSKTLLHFARALAEAGNTEESKAVMERFRQLGPEKRSGVRVGFVDYLSLTDRERHADYRTRLEKAVQNHPGDSALRVDYLKLLLDNDPDRAAAAAHELAAMKPGAALLADAGRALLAAKQYALATDFLEKAGVGVEADLAIARAQAFFASAKSPEAIHAVKQAFDEALLSAPERPDLYQEATAFLAQNGRIAEALETIDLAARILPKDREILLMKAIVGELAQDSAGAARMLAEIQSRWPEWYRVWLAHGIILATHQQFEDARHPLETAVALGARSPEAYFYLADCFLHSNPPDKEAAETAIREALRLAPDDPWILSLAGEIAFKRGDHSLSVERLREAIRLRPGFPPASRLLRAFASAGKAQAEVSTAAGDDPPYLLTLLQGGALHRLSRPDR